MLPELAHQRLLQFQNVVVNSISLKGSGFPTPVLHTSNKPGWTLRLFTRSMTTTAETSSKPKNEYPGLGLPLRNWEWRNYGFYPIGSHSNCYGSDSDIITVRELAMMDIMEKLTDKVDWHKKVFDDAVIAKWRKEALSIPDDHFWQLAVGAKRQRWTHDDNRLELHNDWCDRELENILDEDTFNTVRYFLPKSRSHYSSLAVCSRAS